MNKRRYYIYSVTVAAVVVFVLSIICVLSPDREYSVSERRKLAKLPTVSAESIFSGDFTEDLEKYALDQFPFRDEFRRIKALAQYHLFQFKDNNGIYVIDGHAAEMLYPLNEDSVIRAASKFVKIYDSYLSSWDNKIVFSIVPDKGYYLAGDGGYLSIDYERMENILTERMPFAEYCGIFDVLSAEDYYRTDTHWKQEKILPAAKKIAGSLGIELTEQYTEKETGVDFYGVYYGQSAIPLDPDRIHYVTGESILNASVCQLETGVTGNVYDEEKLQGKDPYDFFLSGASAVQVIDNPAASEQKELIVFRDSYASSMLPYLIEGYSKITLVDLRYIAPEIIGDYVEFENSDVLFLYSTLVLNKSEVLK